MVDAGVYDLEEFIELRRKTLTDSDDLMADIAGFEQRVLDAFNDETKFSEINRYEDMFVNDPYLNAFNATLMTALFIKLYLGESAPLDVERLSEGMFQSKLNLQGGNERYVRNQQSVLVNGESIPRLSFLDARPALERFCDACALNSVPLVPYILKADTGAVSSPDIFEINRVAYMLRYRSNDTVRPHLDLAALLNLQNYALEQGREVSSITTLEKDDTNKTIDLTTDAINYADHYLPLNSESASKIMRLTEGEGRIQITYPGDEHVRPLENELDDLLRNRAPVEVFVNNLGINVVSHFN